MNKTVGRGIEKSRKKRMDRLVGVRKDGGIKLKERGMRRENLQSKGRRLKER